MSNVENFENEGNIPVEREDADFSPAAGESMVVESDRVDDSPPVDQTPQRQPRQQKAVGLTLAKSVRGQVVDAQTGKRFRRGEVVEVSEADAQRLLEQTRQGRPVFVRADS
jgi:hypothetical protein